MNKVEIRTLQSNDTEEEVPPPSFVKPAETCVKKILEILKYDNWVVSILFCDNRYIKSLNAGYRNRDEPTDILSFPLGEKDRSGRFLAGDIVISLDALKENSVFFKVSEEEELIRLLVHGILHLSGEDHATNSAKEPMLQKQEKILKEIKAFGQRSFKDNLFNGESK